MTRLRLARVFWIGAAALLVAAALVALVAVLRGDFSDTDGRILGTLAATLLAGATLVAGLTLVERGGRRLGWSAVVVSLPAFAALVYAIWDFVFDGDGDAWRWGWLGILALLAALIAVTARLLAGRSPLVVRLAAVAGGLATVAAVVSAAAIWSDDPGDTFGRTIAVLWIGTGLAYLLVPVLRRLSKVSMNEPRASLAVVTIKARSNGPLKVEGPVRVIDASGNEFEIPPGRGIVLCRCGHSRTKPFCDSSHKRVGFVADDTAPRHSS